MAVPAIRIRRACVSFEPSDVLSSWVIEDVHVTVGDEVLVMETEIVLEEKHAALDVAVRDDRPISIGQISSITVDLGELNSSLCSTLHFDGGGAADLQATAREYLPLLSKRERAAALRDPFAIEQRCTAVKLVFGAFPMKSDQNSAPTIATRRHDRREVDDRPSCRASHECRGTPCILP